VSQNPRSTVGTVTEIYDYLRLLYARIGVPHCPICGAKVEAQSAQQIVDEVQKLEDGTRIQILAPIIKGRKGTHEKVFDDVRKGGFARVRVDGELRELSDDITIDRYVIHNIEVVVDRLIVRKFEDATTEEARGAESRLTRCYRTALEIGEGVVVVNNLKQHTSY